MRVVECLSIRGKLRRPVLVRLSQVRLDKHLPASFTSAGPAQETDFPVPGFIMLLLRFNVNLSALEKVVRVSLDKRCGPIIYSR
jgi:hypothetical protein